MLVSVFLVIQLIYMTAVLVRAIVRYRLQVVNATTKANLKITRRTRNIARW